MNSKVKIALTVLLASWMLVACGGGGGGSAAVEPPAPVPPSPPPTGGITRTGVAFAVGPITGFGSVIVNGIRYDTSAATFTKDGVVVTQADYAVGHHVVVQGTIDDDNTNGVANSVDFDDNVEGPVSSVETATGTFVVLGQTVSVGAGTSMDDSCPNTLDGLLSVAAVEVSGSVQADGTISATRVECKSVAGEMEVTGTVSSLNTGAMTFQINALIVDFSGANITNFPSGSISDGDLVEAKGMNLDTGGELLATSVEFKSLFSGESEGDHIEVQGFITLFNSATDFEVNGTISVTTDDNTIYEGGAASDLGLNLKVEVEGEFNASGSLLATKVEIKQAKVVRVTGRVDGVDGNSLEILGITITTDPVLTRFEDKSDSDMDPLLIADINPDDYVEVRGQEFPAGSGELAATILERDDPRSRTELRGFVEADGVNRPSLTVLGVSIDTDSGTVYRNASNGNMAPDDFWAQVAVGSLVDVNGSETSTRVLVAEELKLEAGE